MSLVDASGKALASTENAQREAERKSVDQVKREKIPSIAQLDTLYRPFNSQIMVIPLEEITERGGIFIPGVARQIVNEGHVVALGPLMRNDPNAVHCEIEVGDCVCWSQHTEIRFETDASAKFLLLEPHNIIMIIKRDELLASAARRAGLPPKTKRKATRKPRG